MVKSLLHLGLVLLAQADLYGQTPAAVASDKQIHSDILQQQNRAMNVLLGWSALSIVGGAAMLSDDSPITHDCGLQNIGWGAIDGGIALFAK